MEGRLEEPPFVKRSSFVFLRKGRRKRGRGEERIEIGEERQDSVAVRARTHCKEAFHINTIRAVFPMLFCVC
jgi:hypothetical protein